jgi:hypothetical protein
LACVLIDFGSLDERQIIGECAVWSQRNQEKKEPDECLYSAQLKSVSTYLINGVMQVVRGASAEHFAHEHGHRR